MYEGVRDVGKLEGCEGWGTPTVNTDSSERYGYKCKCGCETDYLYVIFKNYARLYRI